MIALIAAFLIPAGPMTQAIEEFSKQADVSVLYEFDGIDSVRSPGVDCPHCTMEAALTILLDGHAHFQNPYRRTITISMQPVAYCEPERGALAPLPPCVQRPMKITQPKRTPII